MESSCVIIVPIGKNRKPVLENFLKEVPRYLKDVNKFNNYQIIISEQDDDESAVFHLTLADNIGALFALKVLKFTHFVFNEVDVIPVKNVDYSIIKNEMGMMNWGTFRVIKEHFFAVNGYNDFMFGWGCDDWDFAARLNVFDFPCEINFSTAIKRKELGEWRDNRLINFDWKNEPNWRTTELQLRNEKIRDFFHKLANTNKEMAKEWTKINGVSNINFDKIQHVKSEKNIHHIKYKSYDYV